jgi:lipoprotein NlpD
MLRVGNRSALTGVLVLLLAACASKGRLPPPVEDRSLSGSARVQTKALPGAENAGKPGFYTVKPGDTLIRIGMDHGQSWRDLARWNSLDNPNVIETGQVLRVSPPAGDTAVVVRPVSSGAVQASPAAPASTTPAPTTPPPAAPAEAVAEEGVSFQWPTRGQVIAGFDENKNKGLDIAGKAGDPVFAAADGKVVYAGSGLRGYGNLIIIKHNNTYLTAYAHNQSLLVKEDQAIKRGQKIAEMGNSDADQVKLHFEIRRQGKPVDPSRYLPAN